MGGRINKISKVECEEGSNRDAEGLRLGVGRGLGESCMREGGNCILKDRAVLVPGDCLEDSRAMAVKGATEESLGEKIAQGIFRGCRCKYLYFGKRGPLSTSV